MNSSMPFGWKKSKNLTHNKISLHLWPMRKETDTININFAQSAWAILWFPFFNWFFELFREVCCLISSRRIFHILRPKKEILPQLWYSWAKIAVKISGENPFLILYNSVAKKAFIFQWCIETEPSLVSNSLWDEFLSLYINLRHRSWRFLMILLFLRLCNINIRGQ